MKEWNDDDVVGRCVRVHCVVFIVYKEAHFQVFIISLAYQHAYLTSSLSSVQLYNTKFNGLECLPAS